jgi:copper transport protein
MFARPVFVAVVVMLALAPSVARAHAVLLDSEPADGAAMAQAPTVLRLRFNEPVTVASFRLIDGLGRNLFGVALPQAASPLVDAPTPSGLGDGRFVLSYRVVSADGHPVAGAITFAVGDAADDEVVPREDAWLERFWQVVTTADRALVYGAVLLAAGNALFMLLVLPGLRTDRACRRHLLVWTGLAAAAVVLAVPLEGAALSASSPAELLDASIWAFGWSTTIGTAANLTLAGLGLIAAGSFLPPPLGLITLGAGALTAVAGFGATGHAATAEPRWLMAPAVVAHGVVAAFWVGSLPPLLRAIRTLPKPAVVAVVHRFSRIATVAIAVLLAAGIAMTAIQLESVAALVTTSYGAILSAKLAAVAVLLGLAAANKWRITPLLAVSGRIRAAADRLRVMIKAEIAVAAAVIIATAALGAIAPPRVLAILALYHDHAPEHAETGYTVAAPIERGTAFLEVHPARVGRNHLRIALRGNPPARTLEARAVTFALSNQAAGIEPLVRQAQRDRDGAFSLTGPEISVAGDWTVRIEALISDFEKITVDLEVPIR